MLSARLGPLLVASTLALGPSGCFRLGGDLRTSPVEGSDGDGDRDGDLDADEADAPADAARDATEDADDGGDGGSPLPFSERLVITTDLDDGELDTSGGWGDGGYAPQGEDACRAYLGGFDPAVYGGLGDTVGFFRFQLPRAVSADATITAARLRLYGRNTWSWRPSDHALTIVAEASADAPRATVVTDAPSDPSGRPVTAARALWGVGGSGELHWIVDGWNESPDLSALVQELVDAHGGLDAGASVQLWIWRVDADDNGEVAAEDFCHPDENHAELLLDWTA